MGRHALLLVAAGFAIDRAVRCRPRQRCQADDESNDVFSRHAFPQQPGLVVSFHEGIGDPDDPVGALVELSFGYSFGK